MLAKLKCIYSAELWESVTGITLTANCLTTSLGHGAEVRDTCVCPDCAPLAAGWELCGRDMTHQHQHQLQASGSGSGVWVW